MKKILSEIRFEDDENPFYVMNDHAQWWCGLRGGKAIFTDNFDEAKTLKRNTQFMTLKRVSDFPIEKIEL